MPVVFVFEVVVSGGLFPDVVVPILVAVAVADGPE